MSLQSTPIPVVDLTCRTPQYDRYLCEALVAEGENITLWASGCHSDTLDDVAIPIRHGWLDAMVDIPVSNSRVQKALKAGEYVLNFVALTIHILTQKPPAVHFQWLPLLDHVPWELTAIRRMQAAGTRVVYTVHDLLPLDGTVGTDIVDRYRRIYRTADALICHTEASKQRLVDEFEIDPSRIWHIPHGPLDAQPGKNETSEQYVDASSVTGADTASHWVVLFGVLRPYKGYEFLLRTWPDVVNSVPDAKLVIAGRASEDVQRDVEASIDAHGISDSVFTTLRYLSDAELKSVIEAADVLVYPYQNITQSGALFTGMTAGKPIVATDVGGLGETITDGKTGRLVPYGDESALAEALVTVLTDPEEQMRLGTAARRELQERFSWEEIARKTRPCYREAAAETT